MALNHLTRFTRTLVLAVLAAAMAAPLAVGGASGSAAPAPDWFERYAAAHPYGQGVVAPDWFERYAAAHPYGQGLSVDLDRRSPDTIDLASAAQFRVGDTRAPGTLVTETTRPAETVQSPGFDWAAAGIGAGLTMMLIGLAALSLARLHRRHRVQTT